ncbi:hypothetical protein AGABI2DRAFT_119973 [Agaricus bisporus var. bisporus H97]|uniref:hypothetical protein n=1 Tax=Agaricus bisporus var. bisporus (strain H97 / ATCC MYA-4626 / FGSC 10389) TaxID=936046 RepID=UPI00029F612A|nr:hypothetical protein AGABI2DRAFT_119973 [Agaricus bisporus var. bisporus H97]EKV45001.1 hypothetical protein AGABI2DRAFT_119973 [Agaricus bisporus var. bisporus H97]
MGRKAQQAVARTTRETRSQKRGASPAPEIPRKKLRTSGKSNYAPVVKSTRPKPQKRPPSIHESTNGEDPESGNIASKPGNNKDDRTSDSSDDSNEEEGDEEEGDEEEGDVNPFKARDTIRVETAQVFNPESDTNTTSQRTPQSSRSVSNSSRASRYESEVPQWQKSRSSSTMSARASSTNTEGTVWGPAAQYNPPRRRTQLICLKSQPEALRKVLNNTKVEVTRQGLFKGFFGLSDPEYLFIGNIIQEEANKLSMEGLAERVSQDRIFRRDLGRTINHRMVLLRSNVKAITVPSDYIGDATYLFPETPDRTPIITRPYEHPCIIHTLKEFLFKEGSRKARLGDQHAIIFKSTNPRRPDRLEIPPSVLALISTAVQATISDWSTGMRINSDFIADTVEDIFTGHTSYISSLKNKSIPKYHAMLHRIYNLVKAGSTLQRNMVNENLERIVDFGGMEGGDSDEDDNANGAQVGPEQVPEQPCSQPL